DQLEESGAHLAELSRETRDRLRELLGPAAAVSNPVDLAGAADAAPEVFGRAVEIIVADPSVGPVLVIGLFGGYGVRFAESLTQGEVRAAETMAEAARVARSGLVVHTMYAAHRTGPLETLGQCGVPVVGSLDVACRCVVELQRRGAWLEREAWAYRPPASVGGEVSPPRRSLSEPEARCMLADAGMDFGAWRVETSADGVVEALDAMGGPLVVKLVSSTITHKSDAGGVILGVDSEESARVAYESIAEGARAYGAEPVAATSVLVALQLPAPRAELLVGAVRDPALGPVLTIGAGGVWVEALGDASLRLLPVDDDEVRTMLSELRLWPVLADRRGFPAVELDAVVHAARAVAEIMRERPDVLEVEVNPVFVYEARALPVDARIVVADIQ
ncbi:MAG: acetate--CoA ligase family protein, partial [Gemmatimonadetes bacterium]|nr:acetate--CoA ligase family protein [Gemmatimonadota bacterium]